MSGPGWYPDPAGVPGRLRYWDGQAWTTQVTDNDPAGTTGTDRRGSAWIWASLAALVVLALIVVFVVINPFKTVEVVEPAPSYSPTTSAWNESEPPTPTPTPTPTPSQPHPSATQLRCDLDGPVRDVAIELTGSRLSVGAISMPLAPDGWDGPQPMNAVRYGEAAYGYTTVIESHGTTQWFNQMVIGPTNFSEPADLETQARTIIACLSGTDVMGRYKAPTTLQLKNITVSGHPAVQADAGYSWKDPELNSRGSLIRVIVADTSDGSFFFLGEATKERTDVIAVMNQLSAGLAVR